MREYGSSGPVVIAIHGGPGAAGTMAPVARELAGRFRVLEPLQRHSGGVPLTVAQHIADLGDIIESRCEGRAPALAGESWGAMLALAFAAAHPDLAGAVALIGCGTFDPISRARLRKTLDERLTDALRQRLERLPEQIADPAERMRVMGDLVAPAYSYDAVEGDSESIQCDPRGHEETWADMLRLQREGVYPAAFTAVRAPVLMLHGAHDPHPGPMIRDNLRQYVPQLEYLEWERCGHSPWLEKAARREFFAALSAWLASNSPADA